MILVKDKSKYKFVIIMIVINLIINFINNIYDNIPFMLLIRV